MSHFGSNWSIDHKSSSETYHVIYDLDTKELVPENTKILNLQGFLFSGTLKGIGSKSNCYALWTFSGKEFIFLSFLPIFYKHYPHLTNITLNKCFFNTLALGVVKTTSHLNRFGPRRNLFRQNVVSLISQGICVWGLVVSIIAPNLDLI